MKAVYTFQAKEGHHVQLQGFLESVCVRMKAAGCEGVSLLRETRSFQKEARWPVPAGGEHFLLVADWKKRSDAEAYEASWASSERRVLEEMLEGPVSLRYLKEVASA